MSTEAGGQNSANSNQAGEDEDEQTGTARLAHNPADHGDPDESRHKTDRREDPGILGVQLPTEEV